MCCKRNVAQPTKGRAGGLKSGRFQEPPYFSFPAGLRQDTLLWGSALWPVGSPLSLAPVAVFCGGGGRVLNRTRDKGQTACSEAVSKLGLPQACSPSRRAKAMSSGWKLQGFLLLLETRESGLRRGSKECLPGGGKPSKPGKEHCS